MEGHFFGTLWQLAMKFIAFWFKLWFRIFTYTGLIYPFIIYLGFSLLIILGYIETPNNTIDGNTFLIFIIVFLLSLIPMVITFIWNIIKTIKSIREKFFSKKNVHRPSVDKKLRGNKTSHGFVFGKYRRKTVLKPESIDGHILVVGGVGSGKSSCIAIPTLRNWKKGVFAIDMKGELYEKTARYRSDIKVFNPQNENSYGYNPYIFLKHSRNPAQEARAIAQAVIPLPPETKEPFWIESAQNILTGAILHYYMEYSFIDTLKKIQFSSPQDLIKTVAESKNEKASLCVGSFVDMDSKTLSGIFTELSNAILTLVTDDEIVSALSRVKIISPDDLEYGQDIYIHIPEHLLRQWKNLLTLIINQFLTSFEKRAENNNQPILFLLDEFPRLGKIPAIIDGLATLRSKKISICLIIQSLAQLDMIYGNNERKVISDTCSYKAVLNATDADTQEYFSKLVGTYDRTQFSSSIAKDAYIGLAKSKSANKSTEEKRIIKPEEFATLQDIVLFTPFGFYRVNKAPYYVGE